MSIILHPTYFPSIAHYIAIANSKNIVFEVADNYQKQTYRNRTLIYAANGKLALTIPVKYSQKNRQLYKDIKIANEDSNWQLLHWKSLESAYKTSPFFEYYEDELRHLFFYKAENLMEHNFKCFETIMDCLQLDISINKTTSFEKDVSHKDFRPLVNARKEAQFDFESYTQVFSNKHGFIPNLSILDLLFNEGPNALTYLESHKL